MTTREDEMAFVEHLRRKAKATEDIGDSTDFADAADRLTALSSERDLLVEALEDARSIIDRMLDRALIHDFGLVENENENKQSPIVTSAKKTLAKIGAALTGSASPH